MQPGLCEIHVPISPTPGFLTRVRYLAASVRVFGGALADSPVIVTIGGERSDLVDDTGWSDRLGIEWRWLDGELWRRHSYFATALERFRYRIEAANALLLDADTILVAPLDDALDANADRQGSLAGVTAHVAPFNDGLVSWQQIFDSAGLGEPTLPCEHSGWGAVEFSPERRYCPPYFNLGVLLANRDVMHRVGELVYSEMGVVDRVFDTRFRCQIALTLAILRSGVPWRALPLRFNFPNHPGFLPKYDAELSDIRILHYCYEPEGFDREVDFSSVEAVERMLERPHLEPIDKLFNERLAQVHEHVLAS